MGIHNYSIESGNWSMDSLKDTKSPVDSLARGEYFNNPYINITYHEIIRIQFSRAYKSQGN